MILNINKPLGITSYDVIKILKKLYPGQKIGHAGTLDPLAEGVLICLIGKESTKRQSEFMGQAKEYEFEILFGFETDTYDILGMIETQSFYTPLDLQEKIAANLNKFTGNIKQQAPKFSALKVEGKPLYRHALSENSNSIELPVREINVQSIEILGAKIIKKADLAFKIKNLLSLVKFGFRQEEIQKKWEESLEFSSQLEFLLVNLKARVSKGAYVRSIAHDLGKMCGLPACTTTIKRTKIGDFLITESKELSNLA